MKNEKWTHVQGNTWCLNLHVTIPVYFLNEREVVLLDTGYPTLDREELIAQLDGQNLHVRAILGSHSHNDHSGSHAYLQKHHGTEVILQRTEAAIVSDYSLMTVAYAPGTVEEMRLHFSELLLQADRTFNTEDTEVLIDGVSFGVIPLPGHTPGHTGIVTPDQVFYVGDALLSESVLRSAKLPSTSNWAEDLASKERMRTMRYSKYILAHTGVYDDISALIDQNIDDKLSRAKQIATWLQEVGPLTTSEAEQLLWTKLDLHSSKFLPRVVFRRNVRCALEFIAREKMISRKFEEGTEFFA